MELQLNADIPTADFLLLVVEARTICSMRIEQEKSISLRQSSNRQLARSPLANARYQRQITYLNSVVMPDEAPNEDEPDSSEPSDDANNTGTDD